MPDHTLTSSTSVVTEVGRDRLLTSYYLTRDAGYVDRYLQGWKAPRPLPLRVDGQTVLLEDLGDESVASWVTQEGSPTPSTQNRSRGTFTQTACGPVLLEERLSADGGTFAELVTSDGTHSVPGAAFSLLSDLTGTMVDDWWWPQPTHTVVTRSGQLYPLCVEGVRSIYTLISAQSSDMRSFDPVAYATTPVSVPSGIGSDLPEPGQARAFSRLDSSGIGERIFTDGKDFYAALNNAYSSDGSKRSLIWGLPPTWQHFYEAEDPFFPGGPPPDVVIDFRLRYFDRLNNLISEDEFHTETIAAVECSPDYWVWNHHDKSMSFSGAAAVPDAADYVILQRRVDGGSWQTQGTDLIMPREPLHLSFAMGQPGRPHWVPGVMRKLS